MSERGSTTLWMAGMVLFVFVVGGLSIDLWRGLAAHRELAAVVDAAAIAAGSGIDETRWRDQGLLRLDPARVDDRVTWSLSAQTGLPIAVDVLVAGDGSSATIVGTARVELTLLRIITQEPLDLRATATAMPVLSG